MMMVVLSPKHTNATPPLSATCSLIASLAADDNSDVSGVRRFFQ